MGTTRADIDRWLSDLYNPGYGEYGYTDKGKKYTHMIVACDTFDYEDYPVFVEEGEDVRKKADSISKQDFGRVMEVYSVNHSREEQLAAGRVFNYD